MPIIEDITLGSVVVVLGALIAAVALIKKGWDKLKEIQDFINSPVFAEIKELRLGMEAMSLRLDSLGIESEKGKSLQLAMAQEQISRAHAIFVDARKIDQASLHVVMDLYKKYSDRGGNSYAAALMHDIESLPVVTLKLRMNQKKGENL